VKSPEIPAGFPGEPPAIHPDMLEPGDGENSSPASRTEVLDLCTKIYMRAQKMFRRCKSRPWFTIGHRANRAVVLQMMHKFARCG
jgi:hypothetical protein